MPRSICFVSLTNFAALSGDDTAGSLGGAEVQQCHVARGLRDRGYKVSFVTYDHGQPDGLDIDGITVFKAFHRGDGLPCLRFVYPRWTGLCAAMRRADAQIYYQRTAGTESGQVCAWCHAHDRRFTFSVASDSDVEPSLPWLKSSLERSFYRYALKNAHCVVVQTRRQQAALAAAFGRQSVAIPSCRPVPPLDAETLTRPPGRPQVLWVGRFTGSKRPQWCLSVAAQCPQFDFHLVGSAFEDAALEQSLRRQAASLVNVTMHGAMPHARMNQFYQDCSVLLCTSGIEGFPNTFLEAWSWGRPVVSSVDPDGVLTKGGLGLVGRTPEELAQSLSVLLESDQRWTRLARGAYAHVSKNHSVAKAVDAYESVFDSIG